jgi:hypothetical protein
MSTKRAKERSDHMSEVSFADEVVEACQVRDVGESGAVSDGEVGGAGWPRGRKS